MKNLCAHGRKHRIDKRIGFPGYEGKLDAAKTASGEKESVLCGVCQIEGMPCAVFAMEPNFMMGSMGSVTGEKSPDCLNGQQRRAFP
jgi:acetyl-CoA carboxylase carboxyl transferase subunit beta